MSAPRARSAYCVSISVLWRDRQRHLTPSCGWLTSTAERTVGPASMIVGGIDTQTRNLRTKSAKPRHGRTVPPQR